MVLKVYFFISNVTRILTDIIYNICVYKCSYFNLMAIFNFFFFFSFSFQNDLGQPSNLHLGLGFVHFGSHLGSPLRPGCSGEATSCSSSFSISDTLLCVETKMKLRIFSFGLRSIN